MRTLLLALTLLFAPLALAADDYGAKMAHEHAHDAPTPSAATAAAPAQTVEAREVVYGTLDGRALRGYRAAPTAAATTPRPGILVFHEWWGLNDNIRAMTRQLAGLGLVALAVDLYGESADDPVRARQLMERTLGAPQPLGAHLRAAMQHLRGTERAPRVATIGWCFGGAMSLETALALPQQVDAAVIYYGRLRSEASTLRALTMPVLGHFGEADQGIPLADVRAFERTLRELGRSPQIHVYAGADHAFANPSGRNYQAAAATLAWQRTEAFLRQHLLQGGAAR